MRRRAGRARPARSGRTSACPASSTCTCTSCRRRSRQGLRAVRPGRAEDRPGVADPLPRQPRGARRAAARPRRTPLLGAALRPQARASRRTSTTGPAASPPTCPSALWSATFYPEPEAAAYVAELVDDGVEVFKVHVQVGEFRLDDPLLDERVGNARGRRHPGRDPRRLRAGRQRVHRPGAARAGAAPLPAADRGRRAHGRPGVRRVPDARRDLRAGPPRHHDGVHDVLRGPGAVPARAAAAAWPTSATRCCSAATSRRSPTPTPTSSSRWPRSTSATTGCAPCAGTTASACSVRPVGAGPTRMGSQLKRG